MSLLIPTLHHGLFHQQRLLESARLPGFGHSADKFYRCDVIFGMPSADCNGTGICRIVVNRQAVPPAGRARKNCQSTGALFVRNGQSGEFSLLLFRELVCTHLYRQHLRHGILELIEPCRLPADLVALLGLPTRVLAPGAYAIETHHGYWQVKFNACAGA